MTDTNLTLEFFADAREILNRGFDKSSDNTPIRSTDALLAESCQKSCQCVSCQNTGCNK